MQGSYSGYCVTFRDGDSLVKLDVTQGVRGINVPVAVERDGNSYSVSFQGEKLEIVGVWANTWARIH